MVRLRAPDNDQQTRYDEEDEGSIEHRIRTALNGPREQCRGQRRMRWQFTQR
jgi:hypothetical protein